MPFDPIHKIFKEEFFKKYDDTKEYCIFKVIKDGCTEIKIIWGKSPSKKEKKSVKENKSIKEGSSKENKSTEENTAKSVKEDKFDYVQVDSNDQSNDQSKDDSTEKDDAFPDF